MTQIALVAALARNGVIGRDNDLPWHLPDDLKRFKALTLGHPVVMGRKTFDAIRRALGRPLPGRTNIVVTRTLRAIEGCEVAHSLDAAFDHASRLDDCLFVIGGGEIFRQSMDRATDLHLTEIHADFDGDATFPEVDIGLWQEVEREPHRAGQEGSDYLDYDFVHYTRRQPAPAEDRR